MPTNTKPTLDQIDMFPRKQHGGYRGGHRKKGGGSTVLRIPNEILSAVTALIEAHKNANQSKPNQEIKPVDAPVLSLVTELKTERPQRYYDAYIKEGYTTQIWAGFGRKPLWLQNLPHGETIEKYRNPNPTQPITSSRRDIENLPDHLEQQP